MLEFNDLDHDEITGESPLPHGRCGRKRERESSIIQQQLNRADCWSVGRGGNNGDGEPISVESVIDVADNG